jgi:cytochrome c-type biogenesis protein CcmH/NrfG
VTYPRDLVSGGRTYETIVRSSTMRGEMNDDREAAEAMMEEVRRARRAREERERQKREAEAREAVRSAARVSLIGTMIVIAVVVLWLWAIWTGVQSYRDAPSFEEQQRICSKPVEEMTPEQLRMCGP